MADSILDRLVKAGWSIPMAEALAENDHSPETAALLSANEAFELYLQWNGIIGYTDSIMNAVDNCRNMEAI